jgi:hypothetical protein
MPMLLFEMATYALANVLLQKIGIFPILLVLKFLKHPSYFPPNKA